MKLPGFDDDALQSLIRLVRRVCLLSEQGDDAAAEELERTQLADAIRDYRLEHGPGALSEERLAEIFVAEQRRAADAIALAELIIPQLIASRPTPEATPRPVPLPAAPAPARRPLGDTSIPGFLDAMLADDSARRRAT